jgi:hypothetical protein
MGWVDGSTFLPNFEAINLETNALHLRSEMLCQCIAVMPGTLHVTVTILYSLGGCKRTGDNFSCVLFL